MCPFVDLKTKPVINICKAKESTSSSQILFNVADLLKISYICYVQKVFFFLKIYFIHECFCSHRKPGVQGRKRALDSTELELQMFTIHHVGAENPMWVFQVGSPAPLNAILNQVSAGNEVSREVCSAFC